jgi:dipeptidase
MKTKSIIIFKSILLSVFFIFNNSIVIKSQSLKKEQFNCFSIMTGKDASVDGSVIFAHNEDDGGNQLVNWYKVPQLFHNHGEEIIIKNGAHIAQVAVTNGLIWLEMPRTDFSDSYMNNYGVTIASDQCSSKETSGELTDGGIGYWLRRIMAERARTSKEAVHIGGQLVEEFGYNSSGRTYCIADPNEAWLMSVVQGKHWVAQRIPDNEITVIPNFYTIKEINLTDTNNFLGSSDIIEYAIQKGWYDPKSKMPFNFRKAYGNASSLNSIHNKARQWATVNILSEHQYDINDDIPFSFIPKNKVSVQDIISVLRNHYEATQYETTGNPHNNSVMTICSSTNQYGFVAQLRNWLPNEIGSVLWLAPRRPCIQPFIPWYCGIDSIAQGYARNDYQTAIEEHFQTSENIYEHVPTLAFWDFVEFAEQIDANYANSIEDVHGKIKNHFEQELFEKQSDVENQFLSIYQTDTSNAIQQITEYTDYWATRAWQNCLYIPTISEHIDIQILQNYPNPFNNTTTIEYIVPEKYKGTVEINIYDSIGKPVKKIIDKSHNKGKQTVKFDASHLPKGIYYYGLKIDNYKEAKKMILIK